MNNSSQEKTSHTPVRLRRKVAGLVVVDIQEKLLTAIHEQESLIKNAICLIKSAELLAVPIVVTEQYPKGLGTTVRAIQQACSSFAALEKLAFSGCGAAGFFEALE